MAGLRSGRLHGGIDEFFTTRAVRRRLDLSRPVGLDVISACLELALQSPRDITTSPGVASVNSTRPGVHSTEGARRAYAGALHLADILGQVRVLVIPRPLGRLDAPSNHEAAGFYGSIVPAIWSFQLALRSRGLGSTYTTAHLRGESRVAALLGMPTT